MWQKARFLSSSSKYSGRELWVRCGPPSKPTKGTDAVDGTSGRADKPMQSNILTDDGGQLWANLVNMELLPEFCEVPPRIRLAEWLAMQWMR